MRRAAVLWVTAAILFATPARSVLLLPGAPWWSAHAAWAAVIALAAGTLRERRPRGR